MKKSLSAIGIILIITVAYTLLPPRVPTSPHISTRYQFETNTPSMKVIGFLPHWNYNKLSVPAIETLTDIAYFSLKIQGDGTIEKLVTPVSEEPGWTIYKRYLDNPPDKPLTIVFSTAKDNEITTLLNSQANQTNIISEISSELIKSGARGINIDIEPSGNATQSERDTFTRFIANLSSKLRSDNPNLEISIDVYPTAASRPRIWDLAALKDHVDFIIIMAYDYHQASSTRAGPNAPLRGSPLETNEDITKNLREILELVPPEKVILGVPFYGYEWTTYSSDKYSSAESGQVASLERVEELIREKNLNVLWDRNTLTPYIIDKSGDDVAQIYFENENSIKLKIDLAKQSQLAGIAFWAIGYEGYNPKLWESISLHLK